MGQEFFINSQELESKVRTLLPSQGGAGAGFDLSASTQIIPIIDLTESAEGSNVRQDLQSALGFSSSTVISIQNTTSTIVNTTGYFRVFGTLSHQASGFAVLTLTDGVSSKEILKYTLINTDIGLQSFDFLVFLEAGESLTGQTDETGAGSTIFNITTRQIADIDGNLSNP